MVGIAPTLQSANMHVADYFIENGDFILNVINDVSSNTYLVTWVNNLKGEFEIWKMN